MFGVKQSAMVQKQGSGGSCKRPVFLVPLSLRRGYKYTIDPDLPLMVIVAFEAWTPIGQEARGRRGCTGKETPESGQNKHQ